MADGILLLPKSLAVESACSLNDCVGRHVRWFESVGSTNDVARDWAKDGAPDGSIVAADDQTRGRGRQGREWVAAPGKSLSVSFVLRCNWPETEAAWLGVLGPLAVVETLRELKIADVTIKWPNDILIAGRKVCGVLVEPYSQRGRVEWAVLGIGLNVGQLTEDFPAELRDTATSLKAHGVNITTDKVLNQLAGHLDRYYRDARRNGPESLRQAWWEWSGVDQLPVLDSSA